MESSNTTISNLLFLLAAAPVGMGCIIVSDDTDDTTGATNNTSGNTSTTGDTDTPPATDTGSGSGSGGMTDTGMATTASMDSTGADESSGGGNVLCTDYGALYDECFPQYSDYEYAESFCEANLDYSSMYSEECGVLAEDYFTCLTTQSCEDLELGGCPDELAAWLDICPTVE